MQWPIEKVSRMVLVAIILLSVMVFGAFFLVGFNAPDEDAPRFTAPLLTGTLLSYIILILLAAFLVGIWSMAKNLRAYSQKGNDAHGVPVRKISYAIIAFTLSTMTVAFITSSSETLLINGSTYEETFWLKAASMFTGTCIIMTLVAISAVIYNYIRQQQNT